ASYSSSAAGVVDFFVVNMADSASMVLLSLALPNVGQIAYRRRGCPWTARLPLPCLPRGPLLQCGIVDLSRSERSTPAGDSAPPRGRVVMPQIPFHLRYTLSRSQRLVPHLRIWGISLSLFIPLLFLFFCVQTVRFACSLSCAGLTLFGSLALGLFFLYR